MQQEQKENGPALWVMNVKPGEKFTVRRYGERDINVRASVGNEGGDMFLCWRDGDFYRYREKDRVELQVEYLSFPPRVRVKWTDNKTNTMYVRPVKVTIAQPIDIGGGVIIG